MKPTVPAVAAAVVFGGLVAGCATGGPGGATTAGRGGVRGDVLTYPDGAGGWVYYEEGEGPQTTQRGVGGVRSVTFGPLFVSFQTDRGTYVIPRDRFVLSAPVGGLRVPPTSSGHGE